MTTRLEVSTRRQILGLALGAFILVFFLWQIADNTIILYPFRLLVTFVHEAGHGLSAILTGGAFLRFDVFPNGAGVATTAGGSRFVVIQMGYLGTALFGAILIYAANRARHVNIVAFVAGLFFIACAVLFTGGSGVGFFGGVILALVLWIGSNSAKRSPNLKRWLEIAAAVVLAITLLTAFSNTALVTGVISGAVLMAIGTLAEPRVTYFLLNTLAFIVGFNAINDITSLWGMVNASYRGVPNDANALAALTNLPVHLWIIIWVVVALLLMGVSAYLAFVRTARE